MTNEEIKNYIIQKVNSIMDREMLIKIYTFIKCWLE